MKIFWSNSKNRCQNSEKLKWKKDITPNRRKNLCLPAVWGRTAGGFYARESRHHGVNSCKREEGKD